MRVMQVAEQKRPRLRRLGDQLGAVDTPVAVAIALSAWAISGDPLRFLAVLVVATPCPLLIAIPVPPLQAIRIGDLAICAIPFETFVETGLDLKRRSPFSRSITVGIANGYNGYLPTPEQHKLDGYETWLSTNKVQEDASVLITNNLLEMLAELAKQK